MPPLTLNYCLYTIWLTSDSSEVLSDGFVIRNYNTSSRKKKLKDERKMKIVQNLSAPTWHAELKHMLRPHGKCLTAGSLNTPR